MLKVDAHQHFWSYRADEHPWMAGDAMTPLRRDFLPADLQPLLQRQGVAATVAVQARASEGETRYLLSLAAQVPWVAGVVGWIDLQAPDIVARCAAWQEAQPSRGGHLVGFRHQVQDEADAQGWLLQPDVVRGVQAVQRAGFVYELLYTQRQLGALAQVVARHDGGPLVLDHLGKPDIAAMQADAAVFEDWRRALAPLRAAPHVFLKLSGLVTEADWQRGLDETAWLWIERCLDEALALVGPERLLWGSDWPVCTLATDADTVLRRFSQWLQTRLSADGQQAVWAANAVRCYGLAVAGHEAAREAAGSSGGADALGQCIVDRQFPDNGV